MITKFFHILSNCPYTVMISVLCNSYFHSCFCGSCIFFFCQQSYFLTIFTKYSSNGFAISMSSSTILLFSTNLIVVLALTLREKRIVTIWQNFLLSDVEFTSRFAKRSFLALFKWFTQKFRYFLYSFVIFCIHFCPIAQKVICKSRTFHNCFV